MTEGLRQIKSFKDVFHNEKVRYSMKGQQSHNKLIKGFYLVVCVVQAIFFIHYFPDLIADNWTYILSLCEWKYMYFYINYLLPILLVVIVNLSYSLVYYIKHPFFEQYKVLKDDWPWEQKDKRKAAQWWKRLLTFAFINLFIINLVLVCIEYSLGGGEDNNYSTDSLPTKFEIIWQLIFFMLCDDFVFYFMHRLFHIPTFYKFHKPHHEHNISASFTGLQFHPLEYIFVEVPCISFGYKILGSRVHIITKIMWFVLRVLETFDGHCGYEFPWAMFRIMPFSGSSDFHNFHHSKNAGNYSSFFTIWDNLFGTNKEYLKYKQLEEKKINEKQKLDAKKTS